MNVSNWNKIPKLKNVEIHTYEPGIIAEKTIARGYGNSYGDASLGNDITSMKSLKETCKIENSILSISAGFTLKEALEFTFNQNLIIPVFPGTQHVSIGGMIAADVHGKNHKSKGSLGNWLSSIKINTGNEIIDCSPTKNQELFMATIGGMGLTGIIVSAEIKLAPVQGSLINQQSTEFNNVIDLIEAITHSKSTNKIAWIDIVGNKHQYFLMEGRSIKNGKKPSIASSKRRFPNFGISILNQTSIKIYNRKFGNNLRSSRNTNVSFTDYFFPLDKIKNWNNAYGRKGFYQYQFALPITNKKGIQIILEKISTSKFTPYLISLKHFGNISSPGILSFPIEGFSLAVDFKNKPDITNFLKELDEIVLLNNGRVYLAKDSLLDEKTFNKMYEDVSKFKSIIKKFSAGKFNSLLSKRLNLID